MVFWIPRLVISITFKQRFGPLCQRLATNFTFLLISETGFIEDSKTVLANSAHFSATQNSHIPTGVKFFTRWMKTAFLVMQWFRLYEVINSYRFSLIFWWCFDEKKWCFMATRPNKGDSPLCVGVDEDQVRARSTTLEGLATRFPVTLPTFLSGFDLYPVNFIWQLNITSSHN